MSFLIALVVTILGILPLVFSKRFFTAVVSGVSALLVNWFVVWASLPSSVWPLWGISGLLVLIDWVLLFIVIAIMDYDSNNYGSSREYGRDLVITGTFAGVGAFIFLAVAFGGCSMVRSGDYAKLIGPVEERVWTEDVQPKDPKHVRLVPLEMAGWLADKQIGDAKGAIGSQFYVAKEYMTLQKINGELWYVAPLEFNGFFQWRSAKVSPGYVKVLAEDPFAPVEVKTDQQFKYTMKAYWGSNLTRHLWRNGYSTRGLRDFSFEIDDSGKAWWVVTVFEPTIAWWGEKATGVVVIDPVNGENHFYPMDKIMTEVPWVDRVVPQKFIASYIDWWGAYTGGWWNSMFGQKDLFGGETPSINYGSDGEPYWVTTLTSSGKDQAMIGVLYTDTRTGKSIRYKARGGTENAVLTAVNNAVQYKQWHGAGPVLYNVYGTMASIVPLLGMNHTFQGVAIVDVDKMTVAIGKDQYEAYRQYQALLAESGQQMTAEFTNDLESIVDAVGRVAFEVKGGETHYFLTIGKTPHIFTGVSELSPKLPITREGDTVAVEFVSSGEDVLPMITFDNHSVKVVASANQTALRSRTAARIDSARVVHAEKSARGEVQNMSDAELKELLKLKKKNP